jgi:uncharacterized protein (DUF1501 family)
MQQHEPHGCNEYRDLSRRSFLGLSAASALVAATPAWLPRVAFAHSRAAVARDVLVSIFLRGGADGLSMCVPFGDPNYYLARPNIAIAPPDSGDQFAATNLDGFFGLPPAMTPLLDAFTSGHLLFVHAAGSPDESRSHFDATRFMEVGKARDTQLFTGWLGRHIMATPPLDEEAVVRAIGISPGLQRRLFGAPKSLPFPDLNDTKLNGRAPTLEERFSAIQEAYARAPAMLRASAQATASTMGVLQAIDFAAYVPAHGATYPESDFGYSLKSTAALIKAQIGVEAVAVDFPSWDTHESQNPASGTMARRMEDLSQSLAAFHRDVIGPGHPVTALIMSEFGRTVAENAAGGTDHGHGNTMMLMGQHIAGGRVLTQWPGLHPDLLYQGQDLEITIDYRDVLAEVLQRRMGNTDLAFVFPDYSPTFRGVTA